MLTREEIRLQFENKTVCLVGNSVKLFDNKNNGSLIDSYDTVCRFNKGISKLGDPCYGNRFDVLFYAHSNVVPMAWRTNPTQFGETYLIQTSIKGRQPERLFNKHKSYIVPITNLRDRLKLIKGQEPSTGMVAIDFVLSFNPKKIVLFGFDWKKNPTFYAKPIDVEPHNYQNEELYINSLKNIEIH